MTDRIQAIDNQIIYFKDKYHTYEDGGGNQFMPVSKLIGKFKQPFAKDRISKAVAVKEGRTQAEVLAEWKRKADASILLGNYIHDSLEIGLQHPEAIQDERMLDIIKELHKILPKGEWLQEQVLANFENKLAGTCDLITVKGKECIIWDYKSNSLDKPVYGKFKAPLHHLEQSKINEYTIQLNIYKNLKELQGFKVVGMRIINILNGKVEVIEVSPLDDEINKMLEYKDKQLPSDIIIKL